jgi:methylmalonyl-CoA mutase
MGRDEIMVIAGGVIPVQDYEYLYKRGVVAIFGPGAKVTETGKEILKVLLETYG